MENTNEIKKEDSNIQNTQGISKKSYWPTYLIIAILMFSFLVRLGFFIDTKDQTVWWDEAEYLMKAKHFASGTSDEGWNPLRELLMSLFWAFLYKFGATELVIRISSYIISLLAIYLTYLVGKELFNKKIGLIAAFLMAIYNQNIFFTYRMLIDIPATVFWLLSIYLFWRGYVKEKNNKYLYLSGISIGFGFLMHYSLLFLVLILIIFMLLTDKLKFLKNRNIWITLVIILIIISPYIIWSLINYKTPLPRYSAAFVASQTGIYTPSSWNAYIKYIPLHLQSILLTLFIIGFIILLINIILSFDLILKNKDKSASNQLLVLLWFLIPLSIYTYASIESSGWSEPRYLLLLLPPISFIIALCLEKIHTFLNPKSKIVSIISVVAILLIGAVFQIRAADQLIQSKIGVPAVKDAGLYIKSNTNKEDTVMINSMQMELAYYSERRIIGFPSNESEMKDKIKFNNVKFTLINGLYRAADWTYSYPENNKDFFEPVEIYFLDDEKTQPAIVIYKVKQI